MLVALVLLATHVGGTLVPVGLIEDALALSGADATWPRRALRCVRELGPSRCLKAFAICRGNSAVAAAARGENLRFHLEEELDRFSWEPFANASESQLNDRLLHQTEQIFMGRDVKMSYPGVRLDVRSSHNGSIRFDLKHDEDEGRGRGTRWRRTFYRVVPFLLIPPLILAAILPFMLPAFMMLSMFAVLINNMAFTGSVFTLLRNNAFDDDYEKKVIYVNDGYKNERMPHLPTETDFPGDGYGEEGFSGSHEGFPSEFSPSDFPVENVHHFDGAVHHFDSGHQKKRHGHRRRPHQPDDDGGGVHGGAGGFPGGVPGGVRDAEDGQDGVYVGSESELFAGGSHNRHEVEAAPGTDFGDFNEFRKSFVTDSQSAA